MPGKKKNSVRAQCWERVVSRPRDGENVRGEWE